MVDGTFAGKEILTTEFGRENATVTIYEIVRFNMETGNGIGIAMALFHTNSTELLAPVDGMILSGHGELYKQTKPACTPCGNGRMGYNR